MSFFSSLSLCLDGIEAAHHWAREICEALSRPNMRFVPIKSAENQGFLMLHQEACWSANAP